MINDTNYLVTPGASRSRRTVTKESERTMTGYNEFERLTDVQLLNAIAGLTEELDAAESIEARDEILHELEGEDEEIIDFRMLGYDYFLSDLYDRSNSLRKEAEQRGLTIKGAEDGTGQR